MTVASALWVPPCPAKGPLRRDWSREAAIAPRAPETPEHHHGGRPPRHRGRACLPRRASGHRGIACPRRLLGSMSVAPRRARCATALMPRPLTLCVPCGGADTALPDLRVAKTAGRHPLARAGRGRSTRRVRQMISLSLFQLPTPCRALVTDSRGYFFARSSRVASGHGTRR